MPPPQRILVDSVHSGDEATRMRPLVIRSAPSSVAALLDSSRERSSTSRLLVEILSCSWPLALTMMAESLPLLVITALVGHADPVSALPASSMSHTGAAVLEAYGLGQLVFSTCAHAFVFGIMSGLDSVAAAAVGFTAAQTTAAQVARTTATANKAHHAYQSLTDEGDINHVPVSPGSPSSGLLGTWVLRCLQLEFIVVSTIIVSLYFGCEHGLRAMGEPEESIAVASAYVNALLVGLPFIAIYLTLNKALQASGVVLPVLAIVTIVKSAAVALIYFELYYLSMDILAIAWTLSAAAIVQVICVYAYMRRSNILTQWFGDEFDNDDEPFSFGAFWHGISVYAILAIPACMAVCLEFVLFDCLGFLAGLLPNAAVELSVHCLLFSTTFTGYMLFSGLSSGVSIVVGQKMGVAGESHAAHRSAMVGTLACMAVSAAIIIGLLFGHELAADLLTSDPNLRARFAECVPVLICYQAVDGINTCATQLLRTLAVQKHAVFLLFTTYYLVGVSTAVGLAFHGGWGVEGLWAGLTVGVGLNAIISTGWLWLYADWPAACDEAVQRAKQEARPYGAQLSSLSVQAF